MLKRWITHLADRAEQGEIRRLERELATTRQELREAQSTMRVLELEQGHLLDVIGRDRERVRAEKKEFITAGVKAVKAAEDEHAK